jgi:hypothetical protein
MLSPHYDKQLFISHFIRGLKAEFRAAVESQVPTTLECAYLLAQVQQEAWEDTKQIPGQQCPLYQARAESIAPKPDVRPAMTIGQGDFWKEHQLQDYRCANGLYYKCGDKFDPTHQCAKKPAAELHSVQVVDTPERLSEVLNMMEMHDLTLAKQLSLSIDALAGSDSSNSLHLQAMVGNQVMLILVDSGSSGSFINEDMAKRLSYTATMTEPVTVRLANNQPLICDKMIPALSWWCQGETFTTSMRVLNIGAYDAILGIDWLKLHSPMSTDWDKKILAFPYNDKYITLRGVRHTSDNLLRELQVDQFLKWAKGNEVWALAVLEPETEDKLSQNEPEIQSVLDEFTDVFTCVGGMSLFWELDLGPAEDMDSHMKLEGSVDKAENAINLIWLPPPYQRNKVFGVTPPCEQSAFAPGKYGIGVPRTHCGIMIVKVEKVQCVNDQCIHRFGHTKLALSGNFAVVLNFTILWPTEEMDRLNSPWDPGGSRFAYSVLNSLTFVGHTIVYSMSSLLMDSIVWADSMSVFLPIECYVQWDPGIVKVVIMYGISVRVDMLHKHCDSMDHYAAKTISDARCCQDEYISKTIMIEVTPCDGGAFSPCKFAGLPPWRRCGFSPGYQEQLHFCRIPSWRHGSVSHGGLIIVFSTKTSVFCSHLVHQVAESILMVKPIEEFPGDTTSLHHRVQSWFSPSDGSHSFGYQSGDDCCFVLAAQANHLFYGRAGTVHKRIVQPCAVESGEYYCFNIQSVESILIGIELQLFVIQSVEHISPLKPKNPRSLLAPAIYSIEFRSNTRTITESVHITGISLEWIPFGFATWHNNKLSSCFDLRIPSDPGIVTIRTASVLSLSWLNYMLELDGVEVTRHCLGTSNVFWGRYCHARTLGDMGLVVMGHGMVIMGWQHQWMATKGESAPGKGIEEIVPSRVAPVPLSPVPYLSGGCSPQAVISSGGRSPQAALSSPHAPVISGSNGVLHLVSDSSILAAVPRPRLGCSIPSPRHLSSPPRRPSWS